MGIRAKRADDAGLDRFHRTRWRADPPRIQKRSPGAGLRVGAVALSHDGVDPDDVREIDMKMLCRLAGAIGATTADIVLFCGVRVVDRRLSSRGWERTGRAAAAALGAPLLVECEDREDVNEWWLVTPDAGFDSMIRSGQYVVETDDVGTYSHLVLAEFGAGLGRVVCVKGADVSNLLLLICGEARMLSLSEDRLFREGVLDWEPGLPGVFGDRSNILLHPAHRPYARPIPRTGWNLVGEWRDRNGDDRAPTLGVAVRRGKRRDGASPFRAVVHAGPYQRGRTRDEAVAALAFAADGGNGHRVLSAAVGSLRGRSVGGIGIRYAEFGV